MFAVQVILYAVTLVFANGGDTQWRNLHKFLDCVSPP